MILVRPAAVNPKQAGEFDTRETSLVGIADGGMNLDSVGFDSNSGVDSIGKRQGAGLMASTLSFQIVLYDFNCLVTQGVPNHVLKRVAY